MATSEQVQSLNLGDVKGGNVHIDAGTAQRIKQYRIDFIKANPGVPVPGVGQIVRHAINQWMDANNFAAVKGNENA